jgi:hypothetical protein
LKVVLVQPVHTPYLVAMTHQSAARVFASVMVGLSAVVTLNACTQGPVDRAQITQWQEDQAAKNDADAGVIASLSSQATPGHDGARVSTTLQSPALPTAITFDCYGDGSLDLQLDSSSSSGTTTTTVESIECADGPHQLDPSALGPDSLTISDLGASSSNADRDTAWILTVRGDDSAS